MNQPATNIATMSNPRATKLIIEVSPPHLAGQALARWLLFPIRAHVDLVSPAAALGADHARAEPRDLSEGAEALSA
jgi:hypothetical protein